MSNKLNEEILEIIKIPTVRQIKGGIPIEYKEAKGKRHLCIRRLDDVSIGLTSVIIKNDGNIDALKKFSSGNIKQYLNMNKVYENI